MECFVHNLQFPVVHILGYILVTPAKNEEKNLPGLIQSAMKQSIKPMVWVIVDDGSTDNTSDILNEAREKHDWIQVVQLKEHRRDLGKHYAYVCNVGFNFAIKHCEMHNLQYDYIGLLDADMILEPEFYSKLIGKFEENPELGIVSGSVYYDAGNKLIMENDREDLPLGGIRLWRKRCFEETGGFYISYSPDAVSNVLAKLRGWELKRFDEIKAIQTRRTSSAEGLWKGHKVQGKSDYFRKYHPLFALAKGLKYLGKSPYYIGIAYLNGFFGSFLQRLDKIDNEEIREYYYHKKFGEVIQYYKNKLRKG